MSYKYAVEIFYSDEDEGFIAVVPELPGCSAFGVTEEEALEEVKVAIELWVTVARKEGREIPAHPNDDLAPGTLNSILKQAGMKERRR